jgi:hypothetical protein
MSKNPGKSKPTLAILGYYLAILAPYEDNLFPSEDKIAPNIQYITYIGKRVAWANTLSKLRALCGG